MTAGAAAALSILALSAACNNATPAPPRAPDRAVAPPAAAVDAASATADAAPAQPSSTVARQLVALGYRELFLRMDHDRVDSLWASSAGELEALVRDPAAEPEARFLAAEILFLEQPGFPPAALRPVLAPVYAEAMAQTGRVTGRWRLMGNQWGLIYQGDGTGALGPHLLALGADAIPVLRALLGNAEPVVYEGSRDATTGNRLGYRIKDVAAYYLGRLAGKKVAFHADLAARDREIEQLARALP